MLLGKRREHYPAGMAEAPKRANDIRMLWLARGRKFVHSDAAPALRARDARALHHGDAPPRRLRALPRHADDDCEEWDDFYAQQADDE